MSANNNQDERIRIGELSRRTGVRADTIRVWERRYGLVEPRRTAKGYRLYSAADERVVRTMRDLTARGLAAAEAAEFARRGDRGIAGPPTAQTASAAGALDPEVQAERLRRALEAFDEEGANAILDESLAGLSLERIVDDLIPAAMGEIGSRWEAGETTIAQEHFASNLIRGRLLGLARGWGTGTGPLALLACPPGELHDIGLIAYGLGLRRHGWRIALLGSDTPIETLEDAVKRLRPQAVVLSVSTAARVEAVAPELRALAERVPVGLGGRGAAAAGKIPGVESLSGDVGRDAALFAPPSGRPRGRVDSTAGGVS